MNDLLPWSTDLTSRGLRMLPQSHLVPVDVWLRDAAGTLFHLSGRGTTVRLRTYDDSDLTVALLRAECDCQSHRTAGAAHRVVLRPGAVPSREVAYDGAARHGWNGVEAAMLRPAALAPVLEELLAAAEVAVGTAGLSAAAGAASVVEPVVGRPVVEPVVEPAETTPVRAV